MKKYQIIMDLTGVEIDACIEAESLEDALKKGSEIRMTDILNLKNVGWNAGYGRVIGVME